MTATKGPKIIPDATWARASALRDKRCSWAGVAEMTGVTVDRLRRKLDPGYAEYRNDQHKANKQRRPKPTREGSAGYVLRGMTMAEVMSAIASVPTDTRDFTARLCGDPLPGRSALDQRKSGSDTFTLFRSVFPANNTPPILGRVDFDKPLAAEPRTGAAG